MPNNTHRVTYAMIGEVYSNVAKTIKYEVIMIAESEYLADIATILDDARGKMIPDRFDSISVYVSCVWINQYGHDQHQFSASLDQLS